MRAATTERPTALAVKVADGAVRVSNWHSTDPDVMSAANAAQGRGEDLATWFDVVVRAGAVAGSGADLARLERAVEGLTVGVASQVTSALGQLERAVAQAVHPRDGELAMASQAAVTRLADGVARLITGPEATVPMRVQAAVKETVDRSLDEIQRALAAQSSHVANLVSGDRDELRRSLLDSVSRQHTELVVAMAEIRAGLASKEAVAAEARHGARKGFTFERACADLFGTIAARAGDGGATPVGGTPGVAGRKGDVVIDLSSLGEPAPRLVVEAKDRSSTAMSVAQWRAELSAAKKNRGATAGIGITRPELMPTAGQRIVVINDRTLVLGWSPDDDDDDLATACYLLMRLSAAGSRPDADTVAVSEVRRQVTDLLHSLTHLDTVLQQAGTARRALGRIDDASAAMRADVEFRVSALQTLLT